MTLTSTAHSPSLQEKLNTLATPIFDPQSPIHLAFISKQFKALHGELQGRLYQYFSPKCAEISLKLIYAFPLSLFIKSLSNPQSAVISLLGGAYLLSCKDEIISTELKINLLHSIAIAFFANLLSIPADFSQDSTLKLLTNSGLMTLNILAANQIETSKELSDEGSATGS